MVFYDAQGNQTLDLLIERNLSLYTLSYYCLLCPLFPRGSHTNHPGKVIICMKNSIKIVLDF